MISMVLWLIKVGTVTVLFPYDKTPPILYPTITPPLPCHSDPSIIPLFWITMTKKNHPVRHPLDACAQVLQANLTSPNLKGRWCQEYTPFSLFTPVSYTCCLHPVLPPLPPYILPFTSCLQNAPFTYYFLMATLFSINTLLVVVGH